MRRAGRARSADRTAAGPQTVSIQSSTMDSRFGVPSNAAAHYLINGAIVKSGSPAKIAVT
ncbi:hypothetical protein AWB79_00141 [Caballeronia hypogeia]|uniref:Uncharacterized protein n=1 Tax=Caballeronia hypogeia TaxID=1777140 RepID=A0A157Z2G7_9BURK|nr:hypothetical protein AWB79_00141 [Caballeronia hypogeia]